MSSTKICFEIISMVNGQDNSKKVKLNLQQGIIDYDFGCNYGFEVVSIGQDKVKLDVVKIEEENITPLKHLIASYDGILEYECNVASKPVHYIITFEQS